MLGCQNVGPDGEINIEALLIPITSKKADESRSAGGCEPDFRFASGRVSATGRVQTANAPIRSSLLR